MNKIILIEIMKMVKVRLAILKLYMDKFKYHIMTRTMFLICVLMATSCVKPHPVETFLKDKYNTDNIELIEVSTIDSAYNSYLIDIGLMLDNDTFTSSYIINDAKDCLDTRNKLVHYYYTLK